MDNKRQQLASYFGVNSRDIYLCTSRHMDQINKYIYNAKVMAKGGWCHHVGAIIG